jgi:hypothetical protein
MDGPGYASFPDKIGGRAYTLRYLMSATIPKTPRTMRMKIKIPTKLFPDALDIIGPAQVLFLIDDNLTWFRTTRNDLPKRAV